MNSLKLKEWDIGRIHFVIFNMSVMNLMNSIIRVLTQHNTIVS